MIFKIDGGKSFRIPMEFACHGFLDSWTVKIRTKDLDFFPSGTIFKQINQHKRKFSSMVDAPEDIWLETTNSRYSLGDEWIIVCKPIEDNLTYLESKLEKKEK